MNKITIYKDVINIGKITNLDPDKLSYELVNTNSIRFSYCGQKILTRKLSELTNDDGLLVFSSITEFDNFFVPLSQEAINNKKEKFLLRNSGRIYGYSDERWISIHDDLYGANYYQYAENAGTGTSPIDEWEHNGIIIPAHYTLKNFFLLGRTNNNQWSDIRICIKEITPNPQSRFASGYDNDNEITTNIIFDGLFSDMVETQSGIAYSGNPTDKHLGKAEINYKFNKESELRLYIKPVGNLTSTRYFYGTWTWEFE